MTKRRKCVYISVCVCSLGLWSAAAQHFANSSAYYRAGTSWNKTLPDGCYHLSEFSSDTKCDKLTDVKPEHTDGRPRDTMMNPVIVNSVSNVKLSSCCQAKCQVK